MKTDRLRRILVVEDDPDIQMVVRIALQSIGGFEVDLCSSGQEALEHAAAAAPDLILLDVMMPGMDGTATLHGLRSQNATSRIPVVFLTAKARPGEIEKFRSLGALDVIAKPFDPMTLADTVKTIWATRS